MQNPAKPAARHDHDDCIAAAMNAAETVCRERGLRFTPTRRRVLEIVWQSHRPVGAYEILERLLGAGRRAAPPTVYRALEFLIDAGLVHRLDSLNAYIGCPEPERAHSGQFLICRRCRTVVEIDEPSIERLVGDAAARAGFLATHQMLEIEGLCRACRREGA